MNGLDTCTRNRQHKFTTQVDRRTGKPTYYACKRCPLRVKAYDADGKLMKMPGR